VLIRLGSASLPSACPYLPLDFLALDFFAFGLNGKLDPILHSKITGLQEGIY